MKQSQLFLKPNLKRSSLYLVILIACQIPLWGEVDETCIHSLSPPLINIHMDLEDADHFLSRLENGGESQLILQIDLYKRKPPFLFLRRDKRVFRQTYEVRGSRDRYSSLYRITGYNGDISYYENRSDFLQHYLINSIEIDSENWNFPDLSAFYVRIKGILIKRAYVQPFHIMQFIDRGNRISMEWECTLEDLRIYQ